MGRVHRFWTWGAVLLFTLVVAGEAFAGGARQHRRVGQRRSVPDYVVAYAALQPLERGSGWGRFVVRDIVLPSGDEKTVRVSVFGLEARAEYLVEADGIEIGSVMTDHKGNGYLKIKEGRSSFDEILNELPPAEDLVSAGIRDAWGSLILDGVFTVVREHVSDPVVHSEKIHLDDETGGDATGMAAVCRKESGAQGFASMAAGLEAGLLYKIVVDTTEVGIVTADEEGQAGIELRVPAEENILPDVLQPVEEIRHVQWFQGELLLLSGFFSGESDTEDRCHELEGRFSRLTDDGFVLIKGEVELEISVTDDTVFEGFDSLAQLEDGDWLEVKACSDGDRLVAGTVELEDDEHDCAELHGTFVVATEDGFVLRKHDRDIEIIVFDETEFEGFENLSELEEGDRLEVEGCWDGERFHARSVEAEEPEQECAKIQGEIVSRSDDGFVLETEDGLIEVLVTEETEFYMFEDLEDLDDGDLVKFWGCFNGEAWMADWIVILEDDDCVELRGIVGERTELGFVLEAGDDRIHVVVTDETVFKYFESLDQLDGGEVVLLEGCFDGDLLVAAWIKLLEDDDCVELHGTIAELSESGFVVQVGDDFVTVLVNDETWFKNFENLDQLGVGYVVALEGCFDGDVLVAAWVHLVEGRGGLEEWVADGTVAELLEDGFVLLADGEEILVVVSDETVFEGYDNFGQMVVNDVVLVEGLCDGDKVFAHRIVRGGI